MAVTPGQAALSQFLLDMQSIKQTMDGVLADVQRCIGSVKHLEGLAAAYAAKLSAGEIPASKSQLVAAMLQDEDVNKYLADAVAVRAALEVFRDAHQGA